MGHMSDISNDSETTLFNVPVKLEKKGKAKKRRKSSSEPEELINAKFNEIFAFPDMNTNIVSSKHLEKLRLKEKKKR
jgi:hypothetical protein